MGDDAHGAGRVYFHPGLCVVARAKIFLFYGVCRACKNACGWETLSRTENPRVVGT